MKMPTLVGIFRFISREKFMLSSSELSMKKLITSVPDCTAYNVDLDKLCNIPNCFIHSESCFLEKDSHQTPRLSCSATLFGNRFSRIYSQAIVHGP